MAKCPYCGSELERYDDKKFYCAHCEKYFATKKSGPKPVNSTEDSQQIKTTASGQAETIDSPKVVEADQQTEKQKDTNDELEQLKARLAALEAEKQQAQQNLALKAESPAKGKTPTVISKVSASPAWIWFKKHWLLVCPVALGIIIFITLLTCLVGIRGTYVNIANPNEFYSFTATNYEYHGISLFDGGEYVDKGTWKKSGNRLLLTYNDEDFGKITEENVIISNDHNKLLALEDELGMQKTFKRVNLVSYSAVVTKVKIIFDANGGVVNGFSATTAKVKIGSKIKAPTPSNSKYDNEFRGWYAEPYGYKNGGTIYNEESAQWENATYYANWYNPNAYTIELSGEASGTLTAYEGDNLLKLLQSKYDGCQFTYNGDTIDSSFFMPGYDIIIDCDFDEAYWQRFDDIFDFVRSSDGCSVSCKNTKISGDIVIPSIYKGNTVTRIGDFRDCTGITSITIPDSVTNISERAFSGCYRLIEVFNKSDLNITAGSTDNGYVGYYAKNVYTPTSGSASTYSTDKDGYIIYTNGANKILIGYTGTETSLTLPEGITEINKYAFADCSKLTSITIPDSVTSIGNDAFSGCSGLTSVTIGSKVTSIGIGAFYGCSSLTSITIPNSVTSIGSSAFYYCSGLTSVTIGSKVTSIGSHAFDNCSSLTAVYITDLAAWCGINFASSSANPLYSAKNLYLNGNLVTELVIPEGVADINSYAFSGCSGLTSITFSDTTTWYRTTSSTNWQNKTGGTSTVVTNSSTNATYLKDTYYNYYWYKL